MRTVLFTTAVFFAVAAASNTALAQAPKGKAPDDPPPSTDRPRLDAPNNLEPPSNPRPRREPRPDDSPSGKAGPRPKGDQPHRYEVPSYPASPSGLMPGGAIVPPGASAGGFGGGIRSGGPGMQGYGGGARFSFGPGMMPGMPGHANPFGEPAPDDPEMRELMKQDADLEQQSMQMAQRVREATGDERQRLRESLAETVGRHFEVRQKRRELQIKRMDEELKRLREEIAKRNDARKSIIDNRLREMTGEPRDLDF